MSFINIDIDIDDIINSMGSYDKQMMVDELYEDGYVAKKVQQVIDEDLDDWDEQIKKLKGNKWKLSKEDEETILRITNKLV
jgi:hypothetical protein